MARTSRTPKLRLGELLVAAGLVSEDKVRHGLDEQRRNNLFLGEALVQLGYVSEEAIAQAIIQQCHLPFLSASQFNIQPDVFNLFPERMYHEYQFIAVDKIDRAIVIIAAGPINLDMMEELERVSECKIYHYVSTWADISAAIKKNSKDIGGEAQIELTGLGSMLLDAPSPNKPGGAGASGANKSVAVSATASGVAKVPGTGQSGVFAAPGTGQSGVFKTSNQSGFNRPNSVVGANKSLASANLSALLSPLGMQKPGPNGVSQVASAAPPSPRLTAFLKSPLKTSGITTMTGVQANGSTQAPNIPGQSGITAITGVPAEPTNPSMSAPDQKISFLNVKK